MGFCVLVVQFKELPVQVQYHLHDTHHLRVPVQLPEVPDEEIQRLKHDLLAEMHRLCQSELLAVHEVFDILGEELVHEVLLWFLALYEFPEIPVAIEDHQPLVKLSDVRQIVLLLAAGDGVDPIQLGLEVLFRERVRLEVPDELFDVKDRRTGTLHDMYNNE